MRGVATGDRASTSFKGKSCPATKIGTYTPAFRRKPGLSMTYPLQIMIMSDVANRTAGRRFTSAQPIIRQVISAYMYQEMPGAVNKADIRCWICAIADIWFSLSRSKYAKPMSCHKIVGTRRRKTTVLTLFSFAGPCAVKPLTKQNVRVWKCTYCIVPLSTSGPNQDVVCSLITGIIRRNFAMSRIGIREPLAAFSLGGRRSRRPSTTIQASTITSETPPATRLMRLVVQSGGGGTAASAESSFAPSLELAGVSSFASLG
mmetsp:Transcript_77757/g.216023  ORF Transcript_77757/g.216023 Transcript_77757/m.216023 type:complete len:260 (+) Transcript_77757:704-1483(+)